MSNFLALGLGPSILAASLAIGCAGADGAEHLGADGGESKSDELGDSDAAPTADAAPVVTNMFVHTAKALYVVDDANFDLTEVGNFESSDSMMDMAVTPDGEIYTISFNAVFRIDPATALASEVFDVPYGNVGMTFLPDGSLLAADNAGDVRSINPLSGAVTEIGSFGGDYALAGDLVAVADGTMYGVADEGPAGTEATSNLLLTVDPLTGNATAVGAIGFAGVFGVAVANDKVYAFTRDGDIIEIEPGTGTGTLVRSYPEMSFWGAGVTPRAVID